MHRHGYGICLAIAVLLSHLLNCIAELNDSTLQFHQYSHQLLNNSISSSSTTNLWPSSHPDKDLELTVGAAANAASDVSKSDDRYAAMLACSSVIYGLAEVANASNTSPICLTQLQHLQRGILSKQPWAMKVLDASGSKPSGFVFGQNYWLGSREACNMVQQPVAITLSKNFERIMNHGLMTQQSPFDIDYRVIYLRHNSPWQVEIKLMSEQIIHIGLCLPTACQSSEIKQLAMDYVAGSFTDNDIFEMQPEVLYMKDLKLRDVFYDRLSFKLVVGSVLITCAFMLCAQQISVAKQLPSEENEDGAGLAPVESEIWRAMHSLLKWHPLQSFVSCYDVASNWRRIFATRESKSSEIPLLNGLRSVCAVLILVFHVMWFMYFTVHNKTVLLSYAEQIVFQYVATAPLLVDVFFTISGFLQTYNFMRNVKQMEAVRQNDLVANIKLFGKLLFHRYLRLGPLYLIIMGSVDLVFAYLGDTSVYHINDRFDELCSQHWWRNLLFIQNLFPFKDMCVNWTWSTACDMQFFLFANLILFLYAKRPKWAQYVAVASLLASIILSYVLGLYYKYEFSFDTIYATGTQLYISPVVRVMPYIVGCIAAWCLLECRLQDKIRERKSRNFWHSSLLVFFVSMHSTFKRDLGSLLTVSLYVLGRFFFSISICWMIVGSATGRGVWWSRLLEARCFQHLNRVSYAVYLLNPLVISIIYSLTTASTHTDPPMLFVVSCGFTIIIYLISIIFSMAFELPYSNLSNLLLRKPKTT
ncbi:nose resistant to fluoxetine protein 6 [Drosophila grimshawi]|uniref:GH20245 n=1 Tax=Drosophila grimshawi TaxID=7222 RepID=B4J5N8_DROGR|nr:nose resistant to fluoxetine protein 6 [Drosophila grimshawi]EDW01814.1 GH20245 [Drosophila grimshawi]